MIEIMKLQEIKEQLGFSDVIIKDSEWDLITKAYAKAKLKRVGDKIDRMKKRANSFAESDRLEELKKSILETPLN